MSSPGLTDSQIQLVEESFAAVAPRGAALVARFYELLFNDYPELKPMSESDPHQQQKKLLGALVLVVENLRKPEKLQPAIEQLGINQNDYQVVQEQHQAIGSTLLKTLAEFAGGMWCSKLEAAWTAVYGTISEQMIESVEPAVAKV